MAFAERLGRSRDLLGWLLAALLVLLYVALPAADERSAGDDLLEDGKDELDRPEIVRVSPSDPYPGSSLRISYAGLPETMQPHVFANGRELTLLARRPGELVARLPRELGPGDLRLKLTGGPTLGALPRSKAFHVRIKAVNLRKVMRGLLGGLALVLLGIRSMSRGVREGTGLAVARAVARASRLRSLAYGLGALLGALVQSTTSAAGVLAALSSAGVLPLAPAAIALIGAQWGAALAPLAATGILEPREGLLAIALGVAWLGLAADRQATARARLALGVGFVAYGLSLLGPALEPFVSDPVLLALMERLRVRGPLDVVPLALLGAGLVALVQGPAALIVLVLALARGTGQWDLASTLALLSGTGLGAATSALLTASAGTEAGRLARLHLVLGALSTLCCALLALPIARLCEALWGALDASSRLGVPLALGFTLSQLCAASVIALLVGPLVARLRAAEGRRGAGRTTGALGRAATAQALAQVLALQRRALDALTELAEHGARSAGQQAEHALAEARAALERLLRDDVDARESSEDAEPGTGVGAPLACLSLQHALEGLLAHAEEGTDARIRLAGDTLEEASPSAARWDGAHVLAELHDLVAEGLEVARASLHSGEPPNLDQARAREIRINRLESQVRAASSARVSPAALAAQQLSLLRVVDAYEVVGNHVFRLTEAMEEAHAALLSP
jgi:Na+/phosphate symporter